MLTINVKLLQDNGVHYGHLAHKRHPKFNPYIIGKQGGIHIINLNETLKKLKEAYDFVYKITSTGGKILYICTKPYAKEIIQREAERSGNFYINSRWLGGMLTNSTTIRQSINKLKDIELVAGKDLSYVGILKKEAAKKERIRKKLDSLFKGIRNMFRLPAAAFIIDIQKEKIALAEVIKSNIPVVAIADTNANPELVDYPVPGNDDSLKTIDLFCQIISAASISGRAVFEKYRDNLKTTEKEGTDKTSNKKFKYKTHTKDKEKTSQTTIAKTTDKATPQAEKAIAKPKDKVAPQAEKVSQTTIAKTTDKVTPQVEKAIAKPKDKLAPQAEKAIAKTTDKATPQVEKVSQTIVKGKKLVKQTATTKAKDEKVIAKTTDKATPQAEKVSQTTVAKSKDKVAPQVEKVIAKTTDKTTIKDKKPVKQTATTKAKDEKVIAKTTDKVTPQVEKAISKPKDKVAPQVEKVNQATVAKSKDKVAPQVEKVIAKTTDKTTIKGKKPVKQRATTKAKDAENK